METATATIEAFRDENQVLEAGTILESSWGYDQTNRDFYRVTRVSAHNVWFIKVPSVEVESTGWGRGLVMPVPQLTEGSELRRKIHHMNSFRTQSGAARIYIEINSYRSASIWDGAPKSYSADR